MIPKNSYGKRDGKKVVGWEGNTSNADREIGFRGRNLSRARNLEIPPHQLKSRVDFPPLKDVEGEASEIQASKGWISLFKGPKVICEGRILNYTEPLSHSKDETPAVIVSEEAVHRESARWDRCLVAYVVGKRPYFQALKARLGVQWNIIDFQMHSISGGFFLLRFSDEADRTKVLLEGPWNFYGRAIVIKEWTMGMELKKDQFNALPIWVRLPNLDLRFWDLDSIGKITSVVGHPRFVDEATANRDRLSYARACVEITPGCEFPTCVNILVGSRWVLQEIHYEWRPDCCHSCNSFDHAGSGCKLRSNDSKSVLRNEDLSARWQEVSNRKKPSNLYSGPETDQVSNSKWMKIGGNSKLSSTVEQGVVLNTFQILQPEILENQGLRTLEVPNFVSAEDPQMGELIKNQNSNTDLNKLDDSNATEDGVVSNIATEDGAVSVEAECVSETPELACRYDREEAVGTVVTHDEAVDHLTLIPPLAALGEHAPSGRLLSYSIGSKCLVNPTVELEASKDLQVLPCPQLPVARVEAPFRTTLGCEEAREDEDYGIPPGFTPSPSDMRMIRERMKEGVSMMPIELQAQFVESVNLAKDDEIIDFFKQNHLLEKSPNTKTNFVTYQNLRRSPRLRKKPAKLAESICPSGLKKGFIK